MPDEGGNGGGGVGGDGGGGPGGTGGGDIAAILAYLNRLNIGNDGDYTGNAGYGGDNTGPVGSKELENDGNPSTALIDALTAPRGKTPGRLQRLSNRNNRSREIEPYSGSKMSTGSLFAFVGVDVDLYSGLPLDIHNPDPFTSLRASDPFVNAEWPPRARRGTPFAARRQASLLASPYLLADNKWQEVVVNGDPGALYSVQEDTDVVQRDTAAYSQRYHAEGGDSVVIFRPDSIIVYSQEKIVRDMKSMGRTDFYLKYSDKLDPNALEQLASLMPKQEFKAPEEDKTKYMDSSGRIGTADNLAAQDLAAGISNLSPSTGLGGAYSLVAVALGADARSATHMGKLGDAWAPVFSMAAAAAPAAFSSKQPASSPPPWQSNRNFGAGKLKLSIINPHFTPIKSVGEAFQGATARVANRLEGNKPLVASYLSSGQNRLATYGPWAEKIVFGNAVERALAQGSAPTGLLVHTGDVRPFLLGGPDYVGADRTPYAGFRFQVTTQLQWRRHWENDALGTIYGLYR